MRILLPEIQAFFEREDRQGEAITSSMSNQKAGTSMTMLPPLAIQTTLCHNEKTFFEIVQIFPSKSCPNR